MALVLLFIKDRPLYSGNGKSYFCTNKNFAPMVVVIGKVSHFGVYGKVFTGQDWVVSKLHLLSFCFDGAHVAGGTFSFIPPPHPLSVLQAGVPLVQLDSPCPCSLLQQGRAWPSSGLDSF